MNLFVGIAILIGLILLSYFLMYNRFVRQKQLIKNSWSNIDTELKRRYDLIPNLVETVKRYAAHESKVFENVAQARTNAISAGDSLAHRSQTENALTGALKSMFAVAENYPDLKASENFLSLQHELTDTEDRIQAARRFYNSNVRDYNTRVETIPSSLIAKFHGFVTAQYFELDEAVRSAGPPEVGFRSATPNS